METIKKDGFNLVRQTNGPDLGYSPTSGVKIIEVDGKVFKSFDGSDTLLPYEDWRLPMEERAADLASRLSVDEIAGLMLYSIQNKLPMPNDTYGGKPFAESGMKAYDLSDAQIKFLTDDNLRHVLVSTVESPETAARWNNKVQALIEGRTHGIPANNSSDPRHSAFADAEFSPAAMAASRCGAICSDLPPHSLPKPLKSSVGLPARNTALSVLPRHCRRKPTSAPTRGGIATAARSDLSHAS